jgi:hypothetical protein
VEGRADQGRARVGFRAPLTSVLPLAGALVLLGLVFPTEGSWTFAIVVVFVSAIVRLRQLMVLTDDHLEITVIRTRRIPWAQVEGFEPGSVGEQRSRPPRGSCGRSPPARGGVAQPTRATSRSCGGRPAPAAETASPRPCGRRSLPDRQGDDDTDELDGRPDHQQGQQHPHDPAPERPSLVLQRPHTSSIPPTRPTLHASASSRRPWGPRLMW